MITPLEGARSRAALLALLASGCLSTGEPLFRDDFAGGGATAVESTPPPMLPLTLPVVTPPAPAPEAQPPEQLLDAARSDVPRESPSAAAPAAAGAGGAPAADEPPMMPPPEPPVAPPAPVAPVVVPTDPCAFGDSLACDSFEDELDGVFPRAAGWLPELPGCSSHVVDSAGPAFSGVKALRGDAGGYPECMVHAALPAEDVYVRTRIFLDGSGSLFSQYVTLLEFGALANRDDPELRIGLRSATDSVCPGVAGLDVSGSGLLGGSETQCTGFALEPERWYCLEAHFARVGSDLSLSVTVDGVVQVTSAFAGAEVWLSPELFVKLGRASYGESGLGSIWHDDFAISREPIPCGP